jgi:prepilin-type N-terminal cleavage/methylation domain-containing protein
LRKAGFTLIELLVVIAIIAILAAILFPVFARAREQARRSNCMANLKQIGSALQMYKQDYSEVWPASPAVYNQTFNYVNGVEQTGNLAPLTVILDPYIKSNAVWRCPSSNRYVVGSDATYGMSATPCVTQESYAFCNTEQYDFIRHGLPNWPNSTVSGISDSKFETPAEKIVMWCIFGMAHTVGKYDAKWMSPATSYPVQFPCLYADGHVILCNGVTTSVFWGPDYIDRN